MWPIAALCAALGVSASGYCAVGKRAKTDAAKLRAQKSVTIATAITQQAKRHKQRYGRPRMTDQLKKLGLSVNHKRVGKEMKRLGLQCKLRRKFKICTTDSKHEYAIAANVLNRQFTTDAPNKAWAADITYIHTAQIPLRISDRLVQQTHRRLGS